MQKQISLAFLAILSTFSLMFAQEDENDIGTETVTVTGAYTPTISDAFKIKSVPEVNDSIVLQKKSISYTINSVPVASTFTPAKGKATAVQKEPPPMLYNSYASAGGGNPANLMAKFYTSRTIDRESSYTLGLDHNSSVGDIEGVALDNIFSDTKLEGSYKKRDRDFDWGADVGFQHQLYNWYGLPEGIFSEAIIDAMDERQNYFMAEAGGHVNVEDSFFNNASVQYRRFWDAISSGENRAIIKAGFQLPVRDEVLEINTVLDYVGGSFENADVNSTTNTSGIDYGQFQVGVNPSLTMLRDDLTLNLGVNIVYGLDNENSESNFYIYPAVTASYRLLDQVAVAYGGVEGALQQNSYYGFVEDNPFVSPTLAIVPTDRQYDAYIGLRGQLSSNLSYNVKGSYTAENRRPLFKLNPRNDFRTDEKAYYFGNSFAVFYDDIKTLGIFGELNLDINRNFTLGINAEVYDYDTETDNPAWNLPNLQGSLFMDYQIGEKWYMGANLFYVGEREDVASIAAQGVPPAQFASTIVELDSFFDANAHLGYRYNDQLSIFLRTHNIANNNYQRWTNFPVQGFQLMAGATYKFDF
ncbi:MAG: TonB-dependent receptor [Bacteroidota bacterium]